MQGMSTRSCGQSVTPSRGGGTQGMSTHSGGQPVTPSRGGVTQGMSTRSGSQLVTQSRGGVTQGMSTRSGSQQVTPSRDGVAQGTTYRPPHIPTSWEEIEDPGAMLDSIYEESVIQIFLNYQEMLCIILSCFFRCTCNSHQVVSRSLPPREVWEFCQKQNVVDVISTRAHYEAILQRPQKDARIYIPARSCVA